MKSLVEVLKNLRNIVDRYQKIPLIETRELSEILRDLGCNISYLVELRKHYYNEFQVAYQNSNARYVSGKVKDAENEVPELDEIRKILDHYKDLRSDLRTQISLWKND
ncbi:MAG: hypothetical protein AAGF96_06095 [Bacteroidota bacterium]